MTCDVCEGKRYNRETLEIKFKGKSIADVLDMSIEEAADFFKAVPSIRDKMVTLQRVGLGYIKVGQQATTLSGGEAQRVALAGALIHRPSLVVADEPTGNLDSKSGAAVLGLLDELRLEEGFALAVATHDAQVAARADRVVTISDGRVAQVPAR